MDYQFEYIKDAYGLDLKKGQSGKYCGRPFVVTGASNYVKVKFEDGEKSNIHPQDAGLEFDK
jgi:hypothetical protein